jgi:hypothetical protein
MYCSLDTLLSASDGGPEPEFSFIGLPLREELPRQLPDYLMRSMENHCFMHQTMGRARDSSIKFVAIDGFIQLWDFVDCTLRVWSLSPDDDMAGWTSECSLCLGSLVEQDEFKKAGLPTDMVPMYPGLSAEEDDVVYFMLGEYKKCCRAHQRSKSKQRCEGWEIPEAKNPQYHLRVDMRHGVLLDSARFPDRISPCVSIATTSVVPCQ